MLSPLSTTYRLLAKLKNEQKAGKAQSTVLVFMRLSSAMARQALRRPTEHTRTRQNKLKVPHAFLDLVFFFLFFFSPLHFFFFSILFTAVDLFKLSPSRGPLGVSIVTIQHTAIVSPAP